MSKQHKSNRILRIAGVVAFSIMPAVALAGSESRAFFAGKIYDERPPLCDAAGTGCGKAAADQWCRFAGYESAMSYRLASRQNVAERDYLVQAGGLCARDTCNGFHLVKCWRSDDDE